MNLTVQQIQEIIKAPNSERKAELRAMDEHDKRCSFHTEPSMEDPEYKKNLLGFVERVIDKDKYQMFEHLLTLPIKTVEFTNGVLDDLKKVFEAQDRYEQYDFSQPELNTTWEELRKAIGEKNYWPTMGFSKMKAEINCFMIVDLPKEQNSLYARPYFYTITPHCVVDTMRKPDSHLEYIIFRLNGVVYAFDDTFYRALEDKEGNRLLSEVPHNLKYTPATPFWDVAYSTKSQLMKQGPVTNSLSQLDWLLIFMTMGDHLDWYAGFPVTIGVEHKCSYVDPLGNRCDGGTIITGPTSSMECPECKKANRTLYGPGSFHRAPARSSADDPDYMDSFRFVSPEFGAIESHDKRIDRKMSWLTYNIAGIPDEVAAEAINEKQVMSQFESRVNVLNEVAENFQRIQKWTCDTICRLAFGDAFKGSTLKYGSRFFLHTAAQLREEYEDAKTKGAAMYELATMRHAIIQTEFKAHPYMKQRTLLMSWLEPYPDMAVADLSGLGVSKELIILKAGLDNFVSRFEREFSDIVTFMQYSPLKQKIDFISEALITYVEEDMAEEEPEPATPPGADPNAPPTN